jgi:formylglycine-generating enzyme required for sulfatase activity
MAVQGRTFLMMAAVVAVIVASLASFAARWEEQDWLTLTYALANATPINTAQEYALKAGDPFRECTGCPQMIVVPAGHFTMGSPGVVKGRDDETPQHQVTIDRPFAVSKFELTFDEWDTCADHGGCDPNTYDGGWGRGRQPVINVSWKDAQRYVAWLSRITGKKYEYAARAGTQTAYPWGDDIQLNGAAMANCVGCGSRWDNKRTAPVGSFPPNVFGLYDMVGNVWEWTEDCYNNSYKGAPADGSAWTIEGDCNKRVLRGGSWGDDPDDLRAAFRRYGDASEARGYYTGFRVARTLNP